MLIDMLKILQQKLHLEEVLGPDLVLDLAPELAYVRAFVEGVRTEEAA